jgi:dephospho-CoA kinase
LEAPRLIGLTGGVSAGKTEALRAFARLGAATISTDEVTHELLETDEVSSLLVERWGEDVAPGGEVDRARVAEIVFRDAGELAWLESVLHPRVGRRVAEWRGELPPATAVAVVEVPLLFETAIEGLFDATVVIVADDERRERRSTSRDITAVESRSGRQLSQDEKASRATHVIANDGTLADLEAEVAAMMRELSAQR